MKFEAKGISINCLPLSIISCQNLVKLSLRGCKGEDGASLVLPPLWGLLSLKILNLSECNIVEMPEGLVGLLCLEKLDLSRNNFERIAASFEELSKLSIIKLKECKMLKSIPKLPPNVKILDTYNCNALETVSSSMSKRVYEINLPADTFISSCFTHLIFTNCDKLSQDSVRNLIADVQERLQVDIKASQGLARRRIHSGYDVNLIYPGSKVPHWFLHQTMGPLIFVKLYPQPNVSLFLGFVVCAVVEFAGCLHDKEFTLRYTCVLTLRDQNGVVNECESHYLSSWFDGSSSINSDHVLIGYNILLPSYFKKNAYIEATVVCFTANENDSQNWYPLECCKVKRCGIRPMYS